MSEHREDWLKQLDEASKQKQEQFLNGIAAKLQRPRVTEKPQHPLQGAPEFWEQFELGEVEKLEMFQRNFEAAGGYVLRAATLTDASNIIVDKAVELKAMHVLRQDEQLLEQLGLEQAMQQVKVRSWNDDALEDWKARAAPRKSRIIPRQSGKKPEPILAGVPI